MGRFVSDTQGGGAADRVLEEWDALRAVHRIFGSVKSNSWTYSVVKPLAASPASCSIYMEYVPGERLSRLASSQLQEAEHHCGVWLGLFHQKSFGPRTTGMIYGDAAQGNFLIHFASQRFTAIDPGQKGAQMGSPYQDLLLHLDGILYGLLPRHGLTAVRAASTFLKAYRCASGRPFDLRAYLVSYVRTCRYSFRRLAKRSRTRMVAGVILSLLAAPLYLFAVPLQLGGVPRRTTLSTCRPAVAWWCASPEYLEIIECFCL